MAGLNYRQFERIYKMLEPPFERYLDSLPLWLHSPGALTDTLLRGQDTNYST